MSDAEKAADWATALRNVSGRDLAWHVSAALRHDGEKVAAKVLDQLGIKTAMDFVRRAA